MWTMRRYAPLTAWKVGLTQFTWNVASDVGHGLRQNCFCCINSESKFTLYGSVLVVGALYSY
jgi:hypothetical protein